MPEYDPWDWTHRQSSQSPLSNTLQVAPAQEATPIQQSQGGSDPLGGFIQAKLLNKGADIAEKKIGTIWGSATPTTLAPVADAVAAPVVDSAMVGASSLVPVAGAEAGMAAASGPLSAGMAGIEGALGAMGPVGWGIGGILLAKKLGLFS